MATITYAVKPHLEGPISTNGAKSRINEYPEAASQSFKRGDWVYLASSGKVTVVPTGALGFNSTAGGKLLGRALKDATGVTNSKIPVELFGNAQVWRLPIVNNGTAAANAYNQSGVAYALYYSSTYGACVDVNDTTNTMVTVQHPVTDYPGQVLGDSAGLVDCVFISSKVVGQ